VGRNHEAGSIIAPRPRGVPLIGVGLEILQGASVHLLLRLITVHPSAHKLHNLVFTLLALLSLEGPLLLFLHGRSLLLGLPGSAFRPLVAMGNGFGFPQPLQNQKGEKELDISKEEKTPKSNKPH